MSDHIDNAAQKEEVENMTVLKAAIEKQMEEFLINEAKRIKKEGITYTEPGSLNYLLYGSEPSKQSLSIKMGKVGERMVQKIITEIDDLELLKCGVQCIDPNSGKNKDLDLLWIDKKNKTIYYREAKSNIEIDSEKLPATIDKINEIINTHLSPTYPDYTIDIGVFNWSIYNRKNLKKGLSNIRTCEKKGIKVEHPEDLFKLLDFNWDEESYYKIFRKVGEIFQGMIS